MYNKYLQSKNKVFTFSYRMKFYNSVWTPFNQQVDVEREFLLENIQNTPFSIHTSCGDGYRSGDGHRGSG